MKQTSVINAIPNRMKHRDMNKKTTAKVCSRSEQKIQLNIKYCIKTGPDAVKVAKKRMGKNKNFTAHIMNS